MPRRLEDVHLLSMLKTEQLHVDLRTLRGPNPHERSFILASADSTYCPSLLETCHAHQLAEASPASALGVPGLIDLPQGVGLPSCTSEWRWASFDGAEQVGPPSLSRFRVLEIVCLRHSKGFLLTGYHSSQKPLAGWIRLVFLTMLISVCVGQIVMLVVCTVRLIQGAMQRGGFR